MKVLLAPSNVANQSTSMAAGLTDLGYDVEVWNFGESPNDFPVDRVFSPKSVEDYFSILVESIEASFDVFHFQTARSLIPSRSGLPQMWDLPLLRSLGKRVIVSFHGSDIRRASHHSRDRWSFYRYADIPCDEEKIDVRLALIHTFAHQTTVSSVLDSVYAPGAKYLPKTLRMSDYDMVGQVHRRRPVVLHASRRRETKGTSMIEEALGALSGTLDFEFRVIEGVSHQELLKAIAEADIVVEKLLGGDAGVLSLEAMALGKVAVARISDEVIAAHPSIPVVNANPDTFQEVISDLIEDAQKRKELGEAGRAYVESEHSSSVAGRILDEIYRSANPGPARPHPDWASDPSPRKLEAAYARIGRLEHKLDALRRRAH
ncbi:hypothetical protein GCM10022261_08890 [Brevibacterium daeguense]|uniref:Glycosyltransferase involved in cell wall biosynthesis n=1 Tax=Brevibacterium daeguense TaxID=909936 RepID=A0ABP8EHH4_9MICO|nr:glycosyltransferase [Brevibacterium daeguense]